MYTELLFRVQFFFSAVGYLPPANKLCEFYVFTPVYHSVQGKGVSRPTPRGEVGGLVKVGVSRPTPRGRLGGLARGSPGPQLGGGGWGVWPGGSRPRSGGRGVGSQHALRQTPPQQRATAAGSMHPTGMHSCLEGFLKNFIMVA